MPGDKEAAALDYDVFTIDLTVKHSDQPLSLLKPARYMQILSLDDTFTFKFNTPRKNPITATLGGGLTDYPGMKITAFYYTNSISSVANASATLAFIYF